MFPDVLQEIKGYFGRDFLLGVFFPVLIFLSASGALFLEITRGLLATLAGWERLTAGSQVLLLLSALIVTLVVSYLIFNFQYGITRLFEGYWPNYRILNWVRNQRIERRKRRKEYLEDRLKLSSTPVAEKSRISAELLTFYPSTKHLNEMMPTRIGSILRNSEIYAYDHYGIDSVVIWTRLRPLLPDSIIAPLVESSTAKDFMLLMCVFAVTFTVIWCIVLAIFTNRWDLFLLCALGWPLAWFCYQTAVQSALAYGEQVKAAFDLHRNDLLAALNRPIPQNAEDERKEWKRLSYFFYKSILLPPIPTSSDKAQSLDEVVKSLADYLKKVNAPPTP